MAPLNAGLRKPRVCAVSYLNTTPLVWGLAEGPQRGAVDLTFAVPSVCAERVIAGVSDLGLMPVVEMARAGFGYIPGLGIACRGTVRSILLVSGGKRFEQVRTLATDNGSRTSVQLARIILAEKFGTEPALRPMAPDLDRMLAVADAALLIGDAALSVDTADLALPYLDLGEQWVEMTGLPMVFALWAGRPEALSPKLEAVLRESCDYGLSHLDQIITEEADRRGFTPWLVEQYLTQNLQVLLEERDYEGMREYLRLAAELSPAPQMEMKTGR